jgi:DNA polymerase (family X)
MGEGHSTRGLETIAVDNRKIAEVLESFAMLLELNDAGPYTVRAYRRAAQTIAAAAVPVAELVRAGRARELRGVGDSIAGRLDELLSTGQIAELAELQRTVAPDLVGLGRYLGLGAQRALALAQALGVRTADEFREAAAAGRLRAVPGVGEKTEARLLAALAREGEPRRGQGLLLSRARELTSAIAGGLDGVVAGDVRRWCETCTHLAVVVVAHDPGPALARFGDLPQVVAILQRDQRRSVGVTVDGVPVTLTVPAPEQFGTELVRATGSPEYLASLGPLPEAADEPQLFQALGRPWCPPELRELRSASPSGRLVQAGDVRGDLHCHTTWSDGRASVEEMGRAAQERGYEYLAICDHTPAVGAVPGLSPDDVRRQAQEIAAANAVLAPFRVLAGIECDILPDGRLDLPDDVLGELDWVQASVHGGQRMPRAELTRRVAAALEHPAVRCLSHPTGRIINRRPENALDLERVFELALAHDVAVEVNGLPPRLDLSGAHVREALAAGVSIVCSTDAHSVRGLANMEYALATARRGGAGPEQVLNTRPWIELERARP